MPFLKRTASIFLGLSAAVIILAVSWSINAKLKPPPLAARPPIRPVPDAIEERYLEILKLYLTRSDFGFDRGPDGLMPPKTEETMLDLETLDNLHACIKSVLAEDIPGDILEAGAWRGGACIFARAALKAYGDPGRRVWVADSFEGLPKPDASRAPATDRALDIKNLNRALAISQEEVRENFRRYGLLDGRVRFLKGWFKDTLPTAPIERLAILRADGDLYESTIDTLVPLYDKVSPGGYVIIDDYYAVDGSRRATDEFRRARAISEPLVRVSRFCVYWRKADLGSNSSR